MDRKKPEPEFNWVPARAKCSPVDMFESLRRLAERDALARNAFHQPGQPEDRFRFKDYSESGERLFSVYDSWGRDRRAADFRLDGDALKVITVGRVEITATVTLAEDGICKFLVGSDELDPWQLLRRALEPLFFPKP